MQFIRLLTALYSLQPAGLKYLVYENVCLTWIVRRRETHIKFVVEQAKSQDVCRSWGNFSTVNALNLLPGYDHL